jgi:hypothetical protein
MPSVPAMACALHHEATRRRNAAALWKPHQENPMKLVRSIFLALAVLLPTAWTVAKAADAPAGDDTAAAGKKEKKSKKSKKADSDKSADDKAAK